MTQNTINEFELFRDFSNVADVLSLIRHNVTLSETLEIISNNLLIEADRLHQRDDYASTKNYRDTLNIVAFKLAELAHSKQCNELS